jgi:diadenosine tetraphosphate (Ap4A) HIT family hydrolase
MPCELCDQDGGVLVHRSNKLRVIRALDADHPAFYRVVWNVHVAEWTDLEPTDRSHMMQSVAKVETILRSALSPTKINLASLGNMVPHLHWHVIARFDWDVRWPAPVWAAKLPNVDESEQSAEQRLAMSLTALDALVASSLQG